MYIYIYFCKTVTRSLTLVLNWANTACRHSTHTSALLFAAAEGGTVRVPVETRIVLGAALRPSHGTAGSQQSISTGRCAQSA